MSDRPPLSPAPPPPPEEVPRAGAARPAGFLSIVFAVAASFFGVRKRRDHDAIADAVKPQHLIVAGLIGAALFVLALIVVVRIVIATAA